ncbi:MAG: 50S ribosomal protein L29 [Caldiserica bacterium]|nr:MAG: 50S ribosomal protein L29 [Caldisericota bacterium]
MKRKEFEALKELTFEELHVKLKDLRERFFNLKIEYERGQLKNYKSMKELKKDIARILTLMNLKRRENAEKS